MVQAEERARREGSEPGRTVEVRLLGRTRYEECLALQRALHLERREGRVGDTLLVTEHDPVLTLGRAARSAALKVPRAVVDQLGIPIVQVERGGDITYHGPGQLVAYPILDLRALGLGVIDLVTALETACAAALDSIGVRAEQRPKLRGLWVGEDKVASVGIFVSRHVSMHGVALNVDPPLEHFDLINPCGLDGVRATSAARLLGRAVSVEEVLPAFLSAFGSAIGVRLSPPRLS